jgi:LmbE family N-acetylglucosaminyl deacetylase
VNVLAFFAHPDDETMLAGGTLALLKRSGTRVHYLCATRGEGGEVGDPPVCEPDELGEVREQEMVCAVQALGGLSLTFLGYTDPRVGAEEELYAYTDNLTMLSGQVAASIRQFQPEVVITHGSNGEYGHPAHVITHQAAAIAVRSFGEDSPLLYTAAAIFDGHPKPRLANKDDHAHLVLDITAALEQKEQAAMCHRTQHALFVRRATQEAGRKVSVPEVIMHMEGLHRVHPPEEDGDPVDDQFAEALRPWMANLDVPPA